MTLPRTNPEAIPTYREIATIHRSETARVFYAERQLGELVVIKQFLDEEDEAARQRFTSEAATLGAFDHPQIPVLLTDRTDHIQPHFVMAPVQGVRDLRDQADPLRISRAIHSILEPVAYVHARGVVHRDINPSNILGRWARKPVLSDFGIAAERAADESSGMPGTFNYMSPEQVFGREVDIPSDLYNLGITFYELLYGRLPHSGHQASPEATVWHLNQEIDFVVPDNKDIPKPLIRVVERATQYDPSDRYQSAEEMQEDMARAMRLAGDSPWS